MIELFGHQREAGYVSTQYFGDKAMFQVDVPEIPEREETITEPMWEGLQLLPAGSVISRTAIAGRTRLVSPGAIYAINPATEESVRSAISRSERREIKVISMPEGTQPALPRPRSYDHDDEQDEEL